MAVLEESNKLDAPGLYCEWQKSSFNSCISQSPVRYKITTSQKVNLMQLFHPQKEKSFFRAGHVYRPSHNFIKKPLKKLRGFYQEPMEGLEPTTC